MELVRYVHLNPVRAGMVATPNDYPWTGHHGYQGNETRCPAWCFNSPVIWKEGAGAINTETSCL